MKPKDLAVMLLSKKKPDAEESDGEEPSMPPLEEVMSEFIDAVKAGDAAAAAKAFKAAKACSDDEPDEDDAE